MARLGLADIAVSPAFLATVDFLGFLGLAELMAPMALPAYLDIAAFQVYLDSVVIAASMAPMVRLVSPVIADSAALMEPMVHLVFQAIVDLAAPTEQMARLESPALAGFLAFLGLVGFQE